MKARFFVCSICGPFAAFVEGRTMPICDSTNGCGGQPAAYETDGIMGDTISTVMNTPLPLLFQDRPSLAPELPGM